MITCLIFVCLLGWFCFFWLLYCDFTKIRSLKKTETKVVLSEWDRNLMAFHEAGHAVVSYFSPEREVILQVTINPTTNGFGHLLTARRQKYNESFISLASTISVLLAGRLAEEIFQAEITTSCISDVIQANQIAREMVLKYSMGKRLRFFQLTDLQSENSQKQLVEDIQEILQTAEQKAREILEEKKDFVYKMAQRLLQKGTLYQDEIQMFFNESE